MSLIELVILLLVAALCGAIGQAITGLSRGGCLVSIGVGLVDTLVGTWVARLLAPPALFVLDVGGSGLPAGWPIPGSAPFVAVIAQTARWRP